MNAHFQLAQHRFAAYLRDPDNHPPPVGVEERRLKIYHELFYNNIEAFLRQGFPVICQILGERDQWHPLVKSFFVSHDCKSPHFVDIPGEFVGYLASDQFPAGDYPLFLTELVHYEWMEMVLDVSGETIDEASIDPDGDLLGEPIVINPVHQLLQYRWPVTLIGPDYQPAEPLPTPVKLLLFRDRRDVIRFIEINDITQLLIEQIANRPRKTGARHLAELANHLPELDPGRVAHHGEKLLGDLRDRDFILGTAKSAGPKSFRRTPWTS